MMGEAGAVLWDRVYRVLVISLCCWLLAAASPSSWTSSHSCAVFATTTNPSFCSSCSSSLKQKAGLEVIRKESVLWRAPVGGCVCVCARVRLKKNKQKNKKKNKTKKTTKQKDPNKNNQRAAPA